MPTILSGLATAVKRPLLTNLPGQFAEKFKLEEEEVRTFLQAYLDEQIQVTKASRKRTGPRGKNGKGRISGYLLFSQDQRPRVKEETPDITFKDTGRELGARWKKLTDKEKGRWNKKADKQNKDNGL